MDLNGIEKCFLSPVKHSKKIGDICEPVEPNMKESCILLDPDGSEVGFYLRSIPPALQNLMNIADAELRSERVPKSRMDRKLPLGHDSRGKKKYRVISQYSTILGSVPPKPHMRRAWGGRSQVHLHKSASIFVKAMLKAGKMGMELVKQYVPTVYEKHMEVISNRLPEKWRFTPYFSSTISNCNIAAPIHQDNANVKGAVNLIITKRQNSKGGNLYVPDYDACFDQCNNSLLVYPAWRNSHGVTPIEPTHQGGYRNSHVWYALDSFASLG